MPPSRATTTKRSSNNPGMTTMDDTSSVFSGTSTTSSTYRHHHAGPLGAATAATAATAVPQPVLSRDASHTPKTTGSLGILIVGIGGANGTTLLAGILAHRRSDPLTWYGPRGEGPLSPNYYGCITQLDQKGGGVGFRDRVKGLADVTMAAIGGWDIRPDKPGDALLRDQILDYDLVRQVRDDMNETVKVFRGWYDPRFIGATQHATATHILDTTTEAPSDAQALQCLRADIRYFKWRNGVVGHTTVIWSASVEPNSDLVPTLKTAEQLLLAIEQTEEERGGQPMPPSLLYATAAVLEGCSFINGGSQNTLSCPGLNDLAKQRLGVYALGTDFKAGQTKFKTAAVEYIRTMGLVPRVIASSNHLGNNDMRNLSTSKATATAKLRVKHDIFAPWEENELDHKVSIMFTPYINDEKRDFVEYTSLGFMGQTHTMVTYTRASDSVLCVPLMIDGAVWCDFFSRASWPFEKVAVAMSYLFKVPEGAAKGVDPGFFAQMRELENQVLAADKSMNGGSLLRDSSVRRRVRIRAEEKRTEWAIPHDARIICGGLACVDMQLNEATGGDGGENIESFEGEKSIGGGSVSMACKTLARLCHGAPLDEGFMQVTPPVVHSIVPLCKVGMDDSGDKLLSLLEKSGDACRNVVTKYSRNYRSRDPSARTALAVLPIYKDGRRGCFFDAASNVNFSSAEMIEMIDSLCPGSTGPSLDTSQLSEEDFAHYNADLEKMTPTYGAFLFGYPHLLPGIQGEALAEVFVEARSIMIEGGIIALDLNGVPESAFVGTTPGGTLNLRDDPIIGAALEHVDILHMNEDELCFIAGCKIGGGNELEDDYAIATAMDAFLLAGVAVVAVTRGRKGSFVRCNDEERFSPSGMLPSSWIDCNAKVGCVELPEGTALNTNGAGDSFTAGLLVASMLRHTGMTVPIESPEQSPIKSPRSPTASRETPAVAQQKKKLTPYTLYMREHYVSLKTQLQDDKKAIFSKCNEMWEAEDNIIRAMYERRADEENGEEEGGSEVAMSVMDAMEMMDSTYNVDSHNRSLLAASSPRNLYMTNRSMNLESAVQFASLVAAYHIDMSTRDRTHLDISQLLERAMVVPSKLEEI